MLPARDLALFLVDFFNVRPAVEQVLVTAFLGAFFLAVAFFVVFVAILFVLKLF
jgi:hypothetical protein